MTRARTVLVLAAHPDDETLGVGGTMAAHAAAGDAVHVLILTDGVSARHDVLEPQKAAARAACSALGAEGVEFAGLPDQRLDGMALLEVIRPIGEAIRELRPEIVYTHHKGDVNQDHRTVFEATMVAARPVGDNPVKQLLAYETPSSTEWAPPETEWAFLGNTFVDISQTLEQKLEAFALYKETHVSEVKEYPHPRSVKALRLHAQHRGVNVGFEAAEAFVMLRDLRSAP